MKFFRPLLLGLALHFTVFQTAFSQNNATNLPPLAPPNITSATPEWAIEMYSEKPNVRLVDWLYGEYFKTHPFEKTVDTRNYKHWRRYLDRYDLVQPGGSILVPTDAERATETRDWLIKKAEHDSDPDRDPMSTWAQLGPYENTGTGTSFTNVQSCQVAFSQSLSDLNVLFSVSQNGKIFKTVNHGDSWAAVGENYFFDGDTWTEQCITVHPSNSSIVYYGSASKIWKTTDGGTTWTTIFTFSGLEPNTILIDPIAPDNVLVCSEKGVFRSTDGGVIFTQVRAGVSWDIRFKTNAPMTVFGIFQNGLKSDFYKSADGGATWNPSLTGWFSLPQTSDGGGRMTVSTGNPNLIYCFILGRVTGDNASQPIVGIAKSTDAGANWTQPVTWNTNKRWTGTGTDSVTINSGQGYYDLDMEVSDANDNLVFFGTQSDWTTTNSFTTVQNLDLVHADVQEIHFNGPNDMWVATDGGMDLLDANLTTNTPKSKGITGTEFWGFDQGWNEDTHVGSYYHNGTSGYRPAYPSNQWRQFGGAEPATGYVSVGNPAKAWFSEVGGRYMPTTIDGEVKSFTYGKFPNESSNGQDRRSEIVAHPQYFDTHFFGTDHILWKTTDAGASFTAQYTFGTNPLDIVTSIEIARSNPLVMYVYQLIEVGYTGKLWKSTDGGTTFNVVAQPAGAPTGDGCFIAVSPSNADSIWVAYNKTSTANKVFQGIVGAGAPAWVNITGPAALTGFVPNAFIHIGGTNGGLYLMSKHTVFYRKVGQTDWQPFGNMLPTKLDCNYLRPFYKEGKLRMATNDRGLWGVDFYEVPTTFYPMATVNKKTAYCQRDTFYFDDYSMVNHTGASWAWSFPGATTVIGASTRNPKVVFGTAGNYTATMTLTTPLGVKTATVTVSVLAECAPDTVRGQALRTVANGDYFVVNDAALTNLTNFTFTGWWKPNGAQDAFAAIFNNGEWCAHCDDEEGLIFDYDGTELWYRWPGNAGNWGSSSGMTIPLNEWSYVALVIRPTGATLYLNDKKYVHNITLTAGSIQNLSIGNGFYSKYFKGDIDEVTMWNRSLTDDEVRRLRHITREDVIAGDPNLIAYWQFNGTSTAMQMQDRVGVRHGSLIGGATIATSTAPIGGGSAQILPLTTGNFLYNFPTVGTSVTMSDCDDLAGSMVATRLNVPPNIVPVAGATATNQWFLNYYSTGTTFAPVESIELTATDVPFIAGISTASDAVLHQRTVNGDAATWAAKAKGTTITGAKIIFNRKANITSGIQIGLSDGAPAFSETDPGSPCGLTDGPIKSLNTNGGGNYARTNTAVPLGTTNTITIAGWVKPTGTQAANAGIFFSASGGATGLNFRSANQLGYHWADGSGSYSWAGGPTVPADVWSHIAMVVKADSAIFYLNGVKSARAAAHVAVNFSSVFHFGNDRGNSSRTMNGELDEIRFYNRALSQGEIRNLRHLTYPSYGAADATLISYFKMNEASGVIYDRKGSTNASLLGTATRLDETGPFNIGLTQRLNVAIANSTAIFDQAGLNITFGPNHPNGELCTSRLDSLPHALPANFEVTGKRYWAINNHGSNNSTLNVTGMVFSGIHVNSTVASRYKLYKRTSNDHLNNWVFVDAADAVTTGTSGSITFNSGLAVTAFSQFVILEKGVRVSAKVFLQANYSTGTGQMGDNLRSAGLLPTAEPYAALGFGHVEGGGETVASSVFSTTGNDAIVDWVFMELRDKNNPATKLFTRSALLQKDGDVVDIDGTAPVHFANAAADDYFIAIKHRNHLAVRTDAVVSLTENATAIDFSNNPAIIYKPVGHPNEAIATLAPGKYGLWAGNANGDLSVKMIGPFPSNNDYLKLLNVLGSSTATQLNVYSQQDLNMDGAVKMIGPFPSNNDYLKLLNVLGSSTTTILQAF